MSQPAPCPSCHVPIPEVVVHAPFCPFCGSRKEQKAPEAVPGVPPPLAAQKPKNAPAADTRPFTSYIVNTTLTFDPRVGYAVIGAHKPDGEPARLRAWDLQNKRVAWEALSRQLQSDDLDYEGMRVHSGNVYVGWERNFRVLDLFTGQQRWGAELSDKPAYDARPWATRGMRVFDAAPIGARGAIWLVTVDDFITCYDRDTGQMLWREERERMPRRIHPLDSGQLIVEGNGEIELVDPAQKTVLDKLSGRIERLDLEGAVGALQVRDWGFRERAGILVHDFRARKELLFEPAEDIEDDVPTVMAFGRVFCALESGAKLFAAPSARTIELLQGFHIKSLAMCGPTLFVLLVKHHGTSYRRVLGIDPQTLAVRFDLGELGTEPDDDYPTQMCSNGYVNVIVTSPANDDDRCELIAVDPRGAILWRKDIGEWRSHWFCGGNVVVCCGQGLRILRPDNGQLVASLMR
ncbi:MAG TPA: PQQ-binding-like beta-propeller repeat protein [Labilithrix sp.]